MGWILPHTVSCVKPIGLCRDLWIRWKSIFTKKYVQRRLVLAQRKGIFLCSAWLQHSVDVPVWTSGCYHVEFGHVQKLLCRPKDFSHLGYLWEGQKLPFGIAEKLLLLQKIGACSEIVLHVWRMLWYAR